MACWPPNASSGDYRFWSQLLSQDSFCCGGTPRAEASVRTKLPPPLHFTRHGDWPLHAPFKERGRTLHQLKFGLVRQVLRGQRSRESSLEPYLEWLDAQWAAGKRNGAELWRRLRTQGFRGSRRVVSEWATRRKRADKADAESLTRIPSARTIARLLTTSRDNLTKSETVTIAAIETGVPLLVTARDIIADFHLMIRRKVENQLAVDRACPRQSGFLLWQRRGERHRGGPGSDNLAVVQRTDRGADHQAQAGKAPDVRTRQT
ncbi:hypothetical protein SAMN05216328_12011 [Ensifer sp. YR511]|nr:hypothetical protein SAMN05216328_12011 [Ensifer sp. YR511]